MPDNVEVILKWAEDDNPRYLTFRGIEQWALHLDEAPWQAPSRPWTLNQGEPMEIRIAEFEDLGVVVFYSVEHATGRVRLLYVGS